MKVLITGANGFVGKPLCAELLRQGHAVRAAVRVADMPTGNIEVATVGSIDGATDWTVALSDVGVVIHLAARVHVMREAAADPLEAFRKVNVAGTEHLARCAAAAGVKRLVYVSSVKVNGESTLSPRRPPRKFSPANGGGEQNVFTSEKLLDPNPSQPPLVRASAARIACLPHFREGADSALTLTRGRACEGAWRGFQPNGPSGFNEEDAPAPQDPYGVSKWEAEQALHRVARETGLEVVIVRPPLIYGAGVKGNFAQMIKVLAKGIPLPLASVRNLRSLVYVGNLVDALILCATHPAAAGQTYLVSDGEDVATPDLLRWLGEAMGRPARLFPCPPGLLRLAGHVVGKSAQVERLAGSLRVDSSKIRQELGWRPPFSLREGLRLTTSPDLLL